MRVMISQPMKGLTKEQIYEARAEAATCLGKQGHEVVDTVFTDTPPENGNQALWYLGKSLQALADVDAVCFIGEWKEARGCLMEYRACIEYGTEVIFFHREYETSILVEEILRCCEKKCRNNIMAALSKVASAVDDRCVFIPCS